jgi:hypothetical protein
MNIESQVCSLDMAKRLKELGVKQESYFIHWKNKYDGDDSWHLDELWQIDDKERFDQISAFTVAELMDLLPRMVDTKQDEPFNTYRFKMEMMVLTETNNLDDLKRVYSTNYECNTIRFSDLPIGKQLTKNIWDDNAANSLAKMLIYLIENNLIERLVTT